MRTTTCTNPRQPFHGTCPYYNANPPLLTRQTHCRSTHGNSDYPKAAYFPSPEFPPVLRSGRNHQSSYPPPLRRFFSNDLAFAARLVRLASRPSSMLQRYLVFFFQVFPSAFGIGPVRCRQPGGQRGSGVGWGTVAVFAVLYSTGRYNALKK